MVLCGWLLVLGDLSLALFRLLFVHPSLAFFLDVLLWLLVGCWLLVFDVGCFVKGTKHDIGHNENQSEYRYCCW